MLYSYFRLVLYLESIGYLIKMGVYTLCTEPHWAPLTPTEPHWPSRSSTEPPLILTISTDSHWLLLSPTELHWAPLILTELHRLQSLHWAPSLTPLTSPESHWAKCRLHLPPLSYIHPSVTHNDSFLSQMNPIILNNIRLFLNCL